MADVTTDEDVVTTAQHKSAVEREYGQYVATEAIHIDGVLAFAEGHPVPVEHVKRFELVKKGVVKSTKSEPVKDAKSS